MMKSIRANRIVAVDGPGRLRSTPDGAVLILERASATKSSDVEIHPYMVVSEAGDYLTATRANLSDGTTDGSSVVAIAKPWRLRRTPWDGKTINSVAYAYTGANTRTATRSVNGQTIVETQTITPPYVAATITDAIEGDVIYAVKLAIADIGVTDDDDNDLTLQDINTDGRAWGVTAVSIA